MLLSMFKSGRSSACAIVQINWNYYKSNGISNAQLISGLPLNETTIAKNLKSVGYNTAMVGKWHLGVGKNFEYLPTKHGFDSYFVSTPERNI